MSTTDQVMQSSSPNKPYSNVSGPALRSRLIEIALEWELRFAVAPAITSALSEYDAAVLLECSEDSYCDCRKLMTAVSRGHDFIFNGKRYQVKANRPSGKRGSSVTLVAKPSNYEWDFLIWILYDRLYVIQEAWLWTATDYQSQLGMKTRISPADMRKGKRLLPRDSAHRGTTEEKELKMDINSLSKRCRAPQLSS